MKTKKKYFGVTFRKVVPAEYELWFEELALKGWHPQKIKHTSSFVMTFEKSQAIKYRYVVDLQAIPKDDYIPTYQDFGWELMGQMSSLFVWRKEYSDERPEAFSDKESILKRNRRFVKAISFSFALFIIASLVVTISFFMNLPRLDTGGIVQFILGMILSYLLTALLASVIYRILKAKENGTFGGG
jgi:hypothetical protein